MRLSISRRRRRIVRVGNGKTLSCEIFAACFTVVKKGYGRRRWSEGRTRNPGVLNRGDVSCRSFSPFTTGRYELGNGSLGKRTFPVSRSPWPFVRKQLVLISGMTSAKVSY